jgi:Cys-tRNA(Pro)/Cys-tRNA(Cys) deacylase
MTPAIQAAKRAKISYSVHEYRHHPHAESYGKEAAEALRVHPGRVFKTLLICLHGANNEFGIGVVPVEKRLDLKTFAAACKSKKATMAEPKVAARITGYIIGGISPLGQRKRRETIIDASALEHETIYVSAGRRGLEMQLNPLDLQRLCNAKIANIKR